MGKNIPAAIGAIVAAAVLVFCLIFFAVPQTPQCIEVSGQIASKTIPLESFTKIEASGQIELYLKQDDSESVAIEAQESIAGLVFAETQNGVLRVGLTGMPCTNGQTNIKVFVSAASIESVKANDFAKVFTEGRIYQEQLFLEASGSALISAEVSVDDLNSFASSMGTIILKGLAERHSARAITGGKIIADGLETLQGFFEASDGGSIDAMVLGEVSAVAKTNGAVSFGGGAAITSKFTESGGTVTETPGSAGNEDDSGDVYLPDEEQPPIDDSETPTEPVCGDAVLEAPEECDYGSDCAVGEECIACECLPLPVPPTGFMPFEACTMQGGSVICAENPACLPDVKNAGNVESDGQPCICCVAA